VLRRFVDDLLREPGGLLPDEEKLKVIAASSALGCAPSNEGRDLTTSGAA
jgi:hypothetical protein